MNLRSAAGGSLARFAHLAGLGRARAADDEKDKDKDKPADDKKDGKAEEDEEEKKPAEEEKKDGKAEEDEEEKKPAEDEEEEEKPSAAAAARKAERARCAAIFAAPEAAANIPLAAHLAFETELPVQAAVGALKAGAAGGGARRGLAERMEGEKPPRLGADGGGTTPDRDTPEGNAAFILNAGRRPKGGK